jgi:hypothetical protein
MSTMRIAGLGLAVCLLACGDTTSAAPDSSSAAPDSSSAAPDASGALSCAATIDAYCAQHACVRSWADVPKCGRTILLCGSFWVVQADLPATESGFDFYDHSTGQLTAVTVASVGCVAGPSSFAAPDTTHCISNASVACDGGM